MGVKLAAASGGSVELVPTNTASNYTVTFPASTGTVLTSAAQSIPKAALPTGSVLQVASTTLQGVVSGGTAGVPSTITNGVQIFSLSFTPTNASSTILVQTSSIAVAENTNSGNRVWVALWDGSTFIAASGGMWSFPHFGGNLNAAYTSINESYAAGSTSARTIQVRAGLDVGTVYANGNGSEDYTGTSQQIRMTVWEIAA